MISITRYSEIISEDIETAEIRLYFATFHLVMIFLLLTLFISVFIDAFKTVNNDERLHGFDRELHDHFWKAVGRLFRCGRSESGQVVVKHTVTFGGRGLDEGVMYGMTGERHVDADNSSVDEEIDDLIKMIGMIYLIIIRLSVIHLHFHKASGNDKSLYNLKAIYCVQVGICNR